MQIEKPQSCVDHTVALSSVIAAAAAMVLFKNLGYRDHHALLFIAGLTLFLFNLIFDVNYKIVESMRKCAENTPRLLSDMQFLQAFLFRIGFKFAGFCGMLLVVSFAYFLFLGFTRDYVQPHLQSIISALPYIVTFCLIYIPVADISMDRREDELYRIGRFVFGKSSLSALWQDKHYLLACVVKMFFAPLMITFAKDDLVWFLSDDFAHATVTFDYYNNLIRMIYTIDVFFACVGYLSAFKLFQSEIRSVENKAWGWVVCLMCYPPFWPTIREAFLNYDNGYGWQQWLDGSPVLIHIWGITLTCLLLIYVWATVSFGIRFSNLTHRGIVTNGAYRWFKHPAYLSKNLSWWMVSIPFIASDGIVSAIRNSILLLMLNGVYFLRARAEEIQLRDDPVYRDYEMWIARNGILSRFSRATFFSHSKSIDVDRIGSN